MIGIQAEQAIKQIGISNPLQACSARPCSHPPPASSASAAPRYSAPLPGAAAPAEVQSQL